MRVTFNNCVPVEKLSQIPYLQNYVGNGFVQSNDPVWTHSPDLHPVVASPELVVEPVEADKTLVEKRREERKSKKSKRR